MDNPTMIVIVIVLFVLAVIAAFQVYRRRARVRIKGPVGTTLEIDASNEPVQSTPGVKVTEAKSRSGGLTATDKTGRGVEVARVEVERDIAVTSAPEEAHPKACPPTKTGEQSKI